MTFRGYKIHIILISFISIVAVGFAVDSFVHSRRLETFADDFAALPGVRRAELGLRAGDPAVVLHLEDVPDFPLLYQEARRLVRERLGRTEADVVFVDDRDEKLQAVFERLHLPLYEGAATGRFVVMERRVRDVLIEMNLVKEDGTFSDGFSYKLSVDGEAVYVELSSSDARLYERIVRADGEGPAAAGGMLH